MPIVPRHIPRTQADNALCEEIRWRCSINSPYTSKVGAHALSKQGSCFFNNDLVRNMAYMLELQSANTRVFNPTSNRLNVYRTNTL